MKKLLLVLLVVALASFLFVGCLPTTPPTEGEGEGEAEVCPAITIAGSYAGVTKTYVKAPSSGGLEVVVTYGQPTEGSLVYAIIGGTSYTLPYYVSADGKTVYAEMSQTLVNLLASCETFMIKTIDCYGECICLQSFTIDSEAPEAKMKVSVPACVCPGCQLVFESDYIVAGTCADDTGCCLDDCSGLASWSIDVYKTDPYDVCCTIPCAEPEAICSGTACPIDCATDCLEGTDYSATSPSAHYVVMSLLDNVGNENKYWLMVSFDSGCNVSAATAWYAPNKAASGSTTDTCVDWTTGGTSLTLSETTGGLDYFFWGEDCKW